MKYKEVLNLTKTEIILYIESEEKTKIIDGLLSLFMNKVDEDLAVNYSKWAMQSNDVDIQKVGIIGMGHIARVYGLKSSKVFEDNIRKIAQSKNPILKGMLEDVKDDFAIYIK